MSSSGLRGNSGSRGMVSRGPRTKDKGPGRASCHPALAHCRFDGKPCAPELVSLGLGQVGTTQYEDEQPGSLDCMVNVLSECGWARAPQ